MPEANAPAQATTRKGNVFIGAAVLIVLVLLVAELDSVIGGVFRAQGLTRNPLEYPLTAVVVGLVFNGIFKLLNLRWLIKPALRTELFLKVGLVLLGASISLGNLLSVGVGGLVQALIMVVSVFFFTWWLAGKAKLGNQLRAVMSSAVAVCGVSAAIAAAGAVHAKREEVSYITTLVIITAIPLMVLMPILASAMGLNPVVAGAWFGGNIDTTAAVVGAGTIFGPEAQQVASVVKLAQNVLIGFVAFGLAMYFAAVVEKRSGVRPSPKVIWQRFPKFVLGFILVSLLASVGAFSPALVSELNRMTQWAFALAFVSVGLEFSMTDLRTAGWRPVAVYGGATVFNTVLALIVASLIFGGVAGA
jgi:uncharacterized integral membrane protein (TIGR00698 family)